VRGAHVAAGRWLARRAAATCRRCAHLCRWAALGGFNVSVDFTVAAALTDAAIEPYAVETGADIVPYADRAAFTTSGSTLFSPSTRTYPGSGNKNVEIVVRRTNGALVLRRTVAVVIELTEQATTSCERDDDNNGGSSTTCTNSCNRGRLSGEEAVAGGRHRAACLPPAPAH